MNEKLHIELTHRQAESLRRLVASGEYRKPDEILAEALDEWLSRHNVEDPELLGKLWDQGVASGEAKPLDFDSLRDEAKHRLTAAKQRGG